MPLVAIYPKEGTLFSDNPLFVLDADWVDDTEREGAELFQEFVQEPDNQERVLEFGFRPGNPDVAIGDPITADNGVDPDQPQTLLEVPEPPVMIELLDRWDEQRKPARVVMVIDVSGLDGRPRGRRPDRRPKLDLANEAAINCPRPVLGRGRGRPPRLLDRDRSTGADDVVRSTSCRSAESATSEHELRELAIDALFPTNGTPLYTASRRATTTRSTPTTPRASTPSCSSATA